jgi:hypothetical protein
VPEVERLEPRVDRLGALEVQDGGEALVGERRVEIADRADDPQRPRALAASSRPAAALACAAASPCASGSASGSA